MIQLFISLSFHLESLKKKYNNKFNLSNKKEAFNYINSDSNNETISSIFNRSF